MNYRKEIKVLEGKLNLLEQNIKSLLSTLKLMHSDDFNVKNYTFRNKTKKLFSLFQEARKTFENIQELVQGNDQDKIMNGGE